MNKIEFLACELIDYELTFEKIQQYLQMAYAVGFQEGINYQRSKHANHMEKPVKQLDLNKKYIKTWPSCRAASRAMEVTNTSIITALKTKNECNNYYWRYA